MEKRLLLIAALACLATAPAADRPFDSGEGAYSALHAAIVGNDVATMKQLLAMGAKLTPRRETGETVLSLAAGANALDAARYLLEQGAEVNARDEWSGWTPLHAAAHAGHPQMLRLLLDHGADIEARTSGHLTTPLHMVVISCRRDFEACARLLLDRGAQVNASDAAGDTPLMEAARRRSATPALVRLLLERGADVQPRDKAGRTALTPLGESAKHTIDLLPEPRPEVRALLLQFGAKEEP